MKKWHSSLVFKMLAFQSQGPGFKSCHKPGLFSHDQTTPLPKPHLFILFLLLSAIYIALRQQHIKYNNKNEQPNKTHRPTEVTLCSEKYCNQ